ncbi:MAG: CBS domain-containing protein [Pseudomonadaceae bacterium]|nr:CBS domain-containing protein [Pseudomonadaceae bacterium]
MVFAIYEQGLRIHTPKEQLLVRPGIRQTQAISASRRLVDHKGDAEHNQDISNQTWIYGYPEQPVNEKDLQQQQKKAMQAYSEVEQSKKKQIPLLPASLVMRSPVITLPANANLNEAWRLMHKEQIHYLVLIDEAGELAGVIDDRELLKEAAGVGELSKQEGVDLATTQARLLVKTPLVTATEETDIRDIARVMRAQRIRAMPIVDTEGALQGLVTRSDLMLGLANQTLEIWT